MYQYRNEKNGEAVNCFPVDTDKVMWIESCGKTLADLITAAKEKWPDVDFSEIDIVSENHHQYSIYYDLHDSNDYVQYFVLSIN